MFIFTFVSQLKKSIVLFLVLVITFPGETAHAFSFIPEFVSHYRHHNEAHHRLSFIDFIGEHVAGEDHHAGKHQHEQDECPMNHDHVLVSLTFVLEKKAVFEGPVLNQVFFAEKAPLPPYRFIFSEFHSAIWQPPKLS